MARSVQNFLNFERNSAPLHGSNVASPGDGGLRVAANSVEVPAAKLARPIIEVLDLHMQFTVNGRSTTVFSGLSYKIPERSFLSIIGPSGCGKSTLLRLIAGLERPTAGDVVFQGREIDGPSKGLIYVFQQYAKSILPWRTVLQNIEFGLRSQKKVARREAREKCLEYVKLVGLEGYEDYFPAQLSGGMQQRVVIARALICEPKVLLMDEPFSALDAMTRAILQELLLTIWQTIPITILFVTHDVEEAVFLSDRIISLGRAPASLREEVKVDL
ncbi:ABC transporter ATP-binding protein, partial [Paraburkholderia sp.]|uniref:ABC transporter ATP-binding protein n=1 Tax=Paraburkholderia sp. TaxID=1926495 RepID=UPI002F41B42E